jgi:hypothetical protein
VSLRPLEAIHSNVWTTKTKFMKGCKYYVNFINDHTKKVWVSAIKHKAEMFQHFLNFLKIMVEKEKDMNIKCLRSNGRGKCFLIEFNEYIKEQNFQRKYSHNYSLK